GRGAARIPSKGQRGATVPIGMTVMAHNAATVVRIQHPRLSTRAQKLRQLLRLKPHNSNEFTLILDSRVLCDQELNECSKQRFASLSDIVHKLEETQVQREFLL